MTDVRHDMHDFLQGMCMTRWRVLMAHLPDKILSKTRRKLAQTPDIAAIHQTNKSIHIHESSFLHEDLQSKCCECPHVVVKSRRRVYELFRSILASLVHPSLQLNPAKFVVGAKNGHFSYFDINKSEALCKMEDIHDGVVYQVDLNTDGNMMVGCSTSPPDTPC